MKCEICGKGILKDSQCIDYKYYHNDCIENLQQENKQLKDNWNKLKVYIKTEIPEDVFIETEWFVSILDKMQELEQGSGDK